MNTHNPYSMNTHNHIPGRTNTHNRTRGRMTNRTHTLKKVFISFDYDEDKSLKDLFIGQAKNPICPFEVIDNSLQEAAPEKDWEKKAEERMSRADIVLVLVGTKTYQAPGVLKEIKLARQLKKKIVQLIGHKDGKHKRVPQAGRLYSWTWENLRKLLC